MYSESQPPLPTSDEPAINVDGILTLVHDDEPTSAGTGLQFAKVLLIGAGIASILGCLTVFLCAEDLLHSELSTFRIRARQQGGRLDSVRAAEVVRQQVISLRVSSVVGAAIGIVFLASAVGIDFHPVPAMLVAVAFLPGLLAMGVVNSADVPYRWGAVSVFAAAMLVLGAILLKAVRVAAELQGLGGRSPDKQVVPRMPVPIWPTLTFLLAHALIVTMPVATIQVLLLCGPGPSATPKPLDTLIISAIGMAIIAVISLSAAVLIRAMIPGSPLAPLRRRAWLVGVARIGLLAVAVAVCSTLLRDSIPLSIRADYRSGFAGLLPWWILVGCVLPAVFEELFFRQVAIQVCRPLMSPGWVVMVSAVMFAAAHVMTPLSMPFVLVLGIILGRAYFESGGLALPITLHFLYNLVIVLASVA